MIQPRNPPHTPEPLPWWYKPDLHCAFHQGALDHDIENCYPLKYEVQKLIKSGMLSFEDRAPNVKANPLPAHDNSSVNMVDVRPGNFRVFDIRHIRQSLVEIHRTLCLINDCEHDHDACVICSVNPRGCVIVKRDIQKLVDEGVIQSQQSKDMGNDMNALQKVLEQACVEQDVIVDQFDHIVANITLCNNLSFCDEELPEEGRNHNLALHISMNYKEDALSNVLVDTGSSLNMLPKSTLARLSYQGAPMRYNGVVVKAFDGSRKTVIREVDLPVKVYQSDFQITFQVMDIHPTYSCLLGRSWIHEVGVITSTLHQKLIFVKNGNLVVVGREKALLIGASISSNKDAREVTHAGGTDKWGRVIEVVKNKNKVGLGFQQGPFIGDVKTMQQVFRNGGFIHEEEQHSNAIIEDEGEGDNVNFVTHRQTCNNWVAVNVLIVVQRSK
ncbi:hypothetical protein KIW84_012959 [Lathyrus oleraceus]|uniref:Uncharacterized protein n=1 Tax=Pisum sativum TaxID=3888 RepID=A0A9D5BJB7_PEA|nr:hypothetical protein KIW84_012959 [Pisum sativum]